MPHGPRLRGPRADCAAPPRRPASRRLRPFRVIGAAPLATPALSVRTCRPVLGPVRALATAPPPIRSCQIARGGLDSFVMGHRRTYTLVRDPSPPCHNAAPRGGIAACAQPFVPATIGVCRVPICILEQARPAFTRCEIDEIASVTPVDSNGAGLWDALRRRKPSPPRRRFDLRSSICHTGFPVTRRDEERVPLRGCATARSVCPSRCVMRVGVTPGLSQSRGARSFVPHALAGPRVENHELPAKRCRPARAAVESPSRFDRAGS